jgi:serine/threonine protein kinase
MNEVAPPNATQLSSIIRERIDAYEQLVSGGEFPNLRDLVDPTEKGFQAVILRELIKVDLERRWRVGQPKKLEDYCREYPDVTDATGIPPLDLIQAEYRVRCRYGDAPSHDEFARRFEIDRAKLMDVLITIDRQRQEEPARIDSVSDDPTGTNDSSNDCADTIPFSPAVGQRSKSAIQASKEVPSTVGRYRVEGKVGSGAFGSVYRCRDDELQRDVAVKLPFGRHATAAVRAEQIMHESRAAARLRHPAIVAVLDTVHCDDGRIAIVSEFVVGKSLRQHLVSHEYTRDEAVVWVAELADALYHAHQHQVVHRDVKPENILIDADRHPRLTDFGLAKMDDQFVHNDKGKSVGTLGYMSPEQAAGNSHWASPQSDIYSLGVVLYELLCGNVPFRSSNISELREQILSRAPTSPRAVDASISPGLEAICVTAMSKTPTARFGSAADMAHSLRNLRPSKRRQAMFAVSVVVGILLLAIGIGGLAAITNRAKPSADNASNAGPKGTGTHTSSVATNSGPYLEILFQRAADKVGYRRLEATDLPLSKGDKLQLHAVLPTPSYAYLYWYDENGKPKRLWPAEPAHVERVSEIWNPPTSDTGWQTWHVIGGAAATEMALLAVSDAPIAPADLQQFETAHCRLQSDSSAPEKLIAVVYPATAKEAASRNINETTVTLKEPLQTEFENEMRRRFRAYFALGFPHN